MDKHPFPNTHWSLVRRASDNDEQTRRKALTTLLTRYQPALHSYLRMVQKLSDDRADELLQAFITDRLLESELLKGADQNRGRFRNLLITSLRNYSISRFRAEKIRKATSIGALQLADHTSDGAAVFEAAWARVLVNNVLRIMKDQCMQSGQQKIWLVFEERVIREIFENAAPTPYEDLARRLQLASPTQASNLLVTAKRLYARLLRKAISEYEREAVDIDAEIKDLQKLLSIAPSEG